MNTYYKSERTKALEELLDHFPDKTNVVVEDAATGYVFYSGTVGECIEYVEKYCKNERCRIEGIADWEVMELDGGVYVTVDLCED